LLHRASGALTLTPLYDLMCTLRYGDNRLAMCIDNIQRTDRVTADRIVNEAVGWGMSRERAVASIDELLDDAPKAMAAARAETADLPDDMFATVERQLSKLRST
jgi:hypothetical protein